MRDVLIIGSGIASCTLALALAKRNLSLTIVPLYDECWYGSLPPLQEINQYLTPFEHTSRAWQQLHEKGESSLKEVIGDDNQSKCHADLLHSLQEQLQAIENVEWLISHTVIELLTLEKHSQSLVDKYREPACFGAYIYDHTVQQIDVYLAKETIIATGDAAALYPYTTQPKQAWGQGIALAYQAGARLLLTEQTLFCPFTLVDYEHPCIPLPSHLLEIGTKLYTWQRHPLDFESNWYKHLHQRNEPHLWLDVRDIQDSKEIEAYCHAYGYSMVSDLLPVAPAIQQAGGGMAVDLVGQTSIHRLRAIGKTACTGLMKKDEVLQVVESIVWAIACAEDIAKNIERFIYYAPEVKPWKKTINGTEIHLTTQWYLLRQIMGLCAGAISNLESIHQGHNLLRQLQYKSTPTFSFDVFQFNQALTMACLILEAKERILLEDHQTQPKLDDVAHNIFGLK